MAAVIDERQVAKVAGQRHISKEGREERGRETRRKAKEKREKKQRGEWQVELGLEAGRARGNRKKQAQSQRARNRVRLIYKVGGRNKKGGGEMDGRGVTKSRARDEKKAQPRDDRSGKTLLPISALIARCIRFVRRFSVASVS